MNIGVQQNNLAEINTHVVVIAAFSDQLKGHTGFNLCDNKLDGYLTRLVDENQWNAKEQQSLLLHTFGKLSANTLLLLGLGNSAKATPGSFRKAAAEAVRQAKKARAESIAFSVPDQFHEFGALAAGQAIAEGAVIADYRFNDYKRDGDNSFEPITDFFVTDVSSDTSVEMETGLQRGIATADGVNLARTLVNTPANLMTPTIMAEEAVNMAKSYGLEWDVLERDQMQELGMGALLAVAQGSAEPPKMIVIRYQGRADWDDAIAIVGKGITFDSGGLSIKTRIGMETMKTDMGGAASVLGTMKAIAQLKPPINVLAVVPATENMPSGTSYRPGDVITAMTGKTIEVLNTDAEGRLALADATAYAKTLGATRIIDLATLTGAAVVSLGKVATAVMTNNESFLSGFMTAAKKAEEKVWQLPAFEEYRKLIETDIADVKNTGGPHAGTITAGLFIQTFVEDTPWIHLDIAGTAFTDKATELHGKGATGVMVRSLVEYLTSQSK